MATFNKRDDALRGYVSDIDVDKYGKVLIGLQQGYDKNVGELTKLDEGLKKIADSQLVRQEAKDYFFKRMRERKDALEKNMGNFAHANELDYGMKTLYSAVDDNVAMEIYNSAIPTKIQEQYKKYAESKNPQLANSVNLEYSMQDIQSWVNSKAPVGARFQGNTTYIPHVDVMKHLNDEIKKTIPDAFAVVTENGLQIRTSNGDFLKPARVKEIVELAISSNPQISKQIEINGWNQFRGVDDNNFLLGAKNKIKGYIDNYDKSAEAEKPYTAGAGLVGSNSIAESARRSQAYDESAAKYYRSILVGADGKSGLMAMSKLTPQTRKELETLIMGEDIKSNAANSFAYFAVKKSDIKLNEAETFKATYEQNQQKIDIDKLKLLKESNPSATMEDAIAAGISPQSAKTFLNPDNTIIVPTEIESKTESNDDALEIITKQEDEIYKEIGQLVEKTTILKTNDKVEGAKARKIWMDKHYKNDPNAIKDYRAGLTDALKKQKNITPFEVEHINKTLEKLDELERYKNFNNERLSYSPSTKIADAQVAVRRATNLDEHNKAMENLNRITRESLKYKSGNNYSGNLHKLAEKNGILVLASKDGEVEIKDPALIAAALKSANDKELVGWGLADAKSIKTAVDKSIMEKDAPSFPIKSLKIKSDGTAVLVKTDGDEALLSGYTSDSKIGVLISNYRQNVLAQQEKLKKSIELKADAKRLEGKQYFASINGKTGVVQINANNENVWATVTYNGETKKVIDENGSPFFPIAEKQHDNVNLAAKVKLYIQDVIKKLESQEGNGGK